MRIYRKPLPSVTNIQPPKRMDIWYAHLRENTGTSVQEGDRPVLVISNDVANRCSDVVTVLPMTSQIKKMYMPTHCIISDLDLLTIGLVNDMFTERQNDDYPYKELASQSDFDRF